MRSAIAVLSLCLSLSACGPHGVELTILSDASLSDAELAGLRQLRVDVSGAEAASAAYPLSAGLRREERLVYFPIVQSGMLHITVTALAESATPAAVAEASVTLDGGNGAATLRLTHDMVGPGPDGGAGPIVSPAGPITLGPRDTQAFAADVAVSWSVEEGAMGGSITPGGLYTAPALVGVYHVLATPLGGAAVAVTVNVVPTLSLLAGALGGPGYTDGVGPASRFNGVEGLACDGTNVYVTDTGNSTIRAISLATGVVTTLAGGTSLRGSLDGTGTQARFALPRGLAYDGGKLYVADRVNFAIRMIVLATGKVTTLAGDPGYSETVDGVGTSAHFRTPTGLAVDTTAGALFVSDLGDHVIRRLELSTLKVTTVAGGVGMPGTQDSNTGTVARFNQPYGLAYDAATHKIYIADQNNHTIRALDTLTNEVATLAGTAASGGHKDGVGTAAHFFVPTGVVADGQGKLFVGDTFNQVIRQIERPHAQVTTLAGMPGMSGSSDGVDTGARFFNPAALAVDGSGRLFVSDSTNATIRQLIVASGTVSTLAGMPAAIGATDGPGSTARFFAPEPLTFDGADTLFIGERSGRRVRTLSVSTGAVTTFSATGGGFGLVYDGVNTLYAALVENTILQLTRSPAAVTLLAGAANVPGSTDDIGAAARFARPRGLALDGVGNLFIADSQNHTIRKLKLSTQNVATFVGKAGTPGFVDDTGAAARFSGPTGLVIMGGALYALDGGNGAIRRIDLSTAAVTTIANGLYGPSEIIADGKGGFFVGCDEDGTLHRVTTTGVNTLIAGVPLQRQVVLGPLPGGLNAPDGLALLPNGDLVIADTAENSLLVIRGL